MKDSSRPESLDYNNSKIKRKNRRLSLKIIIPIFLLLLVLGRYVYINFYKNSVYSIGSPVEYQGLVPSKCMLIKDEYIYSINGTIIPTKDKKVGVGVEIGSDNKYIIPSNMTIEEIQKDIDDLKLMKKNFRRVSRESIPIDMDNLLKLKSNIVNEEYTDIKKWYDANFSNLNVDLDKIERMISVLEIEKNMLKGQGKSIVSSTSGVVVGSIDGYENILNPSIIQDIKSDFYIREGLSIAGGISSTGIKMANNISFSIVFSVDTAKLKTSYEIGSQIAIKIGKNDPIKGRVTSINLVDKTISITATFYEGFQYIVDKRFIDFNLIDYSTNVYSINNKSIIKKDGQNGVMVKGASGVVGFYPINIIKQESSTSLIDAGIDGLITINDKKIGTVKEFMNIISNPKTVKEGELLN